MNPAEAVAGLLDLAESGKVFGNNQVYPPGDPQYNPQVFGRGFDFETTTQVPDFSGDGTVAAAIKLRVIRKADGSLYLRTWLIWATSAGEHRAFADYMGITPENIDGRLAYTPVIPEDLATAAKNVSSQEDAADVRIAITHSTIRQLEEQGTTWRHFLPYELDDPLYTEAAAYHQHVVTEATMGPDGEPLCMLAPNEFGEMHPDEFERLLVWTTAQLSKH